MTDPQTGPQMSARVDWQPWCAHTLHSARAAGKPILLFISHGANSDCQQLARECFADAATVEVMNELFVNIRVDRDAYAHLDHVGQWAHRLLTRQPGGWPLSVFLTHDGAVPFFTGVALRRDAGNGVPAFIDVLLRVAHYYHAESAAVAAQSQLLTDTWQAQLAAEAAAAAELTPAAGLTARQQLQALFDRQHGGWGTAPKFPRPAAIQALLRGWQATAHDAAPDLQALFMAMLSLQRMAEGGLQDPADGGFRSHCLDAAWQSPVRVKTLADNALLLGAYAAATLATGDPFHARVVTATARFMVRELQRPDGGFISGVTPAPHDESSETGRIVVGCNSMAIRALADASRALGQNELAEVALRTLNRLREQLWRNDGLLASDARDAPPASLTDHVLLVDAILALQSLHFDADQLHWACQLLDSVLTRFADTRHGGFFLTAEQQPTLLGRCRVFHDDTLPSGNGMAAQVLLRLGHLLGEQRYLQAAEACLRAGLPLATAQPLNHMNLFIGLDEQLRPPMFVIIRGSAQAMLAWQTALAKLYAPRAMVLCIDSSISGLPSTLAACVPAEEPVAYVLNAYGRSGPLTALPLILAALRSA